MTKFSLINIHAKYKKDGGKFNFKIFRKVCIAFNERAIDKIIYEGMALDMGANLSHLQVVRVKKRWLGQRVDWKESYIYRQELMDQGVKPEEFKGPNNPNGVKWFIFRLDDHYVRFQWKKYNAKVPNKIFYRFDPTKGAKGVTLKLARHLQQDPLAHLKYDVI